MSTAVATSVVGDLILARLLALGKRPPAPKRLREDIARFFRHPPGSEAWQGHLDELIQAGLLTARPYQLTDAGRARALEFLGVETLPPRTDWKTIRYRYLVPAALGIPAADPETRKWVSGSEGLAAFVLKTHYGLPAAAGTTPARAVEALVCKKLGYPGLVNLREVRDVILARELEASEPLEWEQVQKLLPRRVVDARRSGADGLREAVLQRWLDGQRPEPRDFDLPAFAATVRAAARHCPTGRFGDNKVFINHVWRHLRGEPGFPAMDLPAFKQRLTEANHAGLLRLERADLVQAMDPADVRESETPYLNAVFHFILIERDRP